MVIRPSNALVEAATELACIQEVLESNLEGDIW
jgi:hypothetical protein